MQKQIRRFEVSVNNLDCEIAFESCILALLGPKGKKVKSIALYFCELHSTAIVLSNIKFSSILHFVWIHLKILESTLGATSNETFSVLMPDILLQGLCSAAFLDRFLGQLRSKADDNAKKNNNGLKCAIIPFDNMYLHNMSWRKEGSYFELIQYCQYCYTCYMISLRYHR